MNFKKLAFWTTLFTTSAVPLATAQNPTILQGNYITNVFGQSNFVLNPNAQTNVLNVTKSASAVISRNATTPLVATSDFSIYSTANGQTWDWLTRAFDKGMKNQNCEARFTYKNMQSTTTAQLLQNNLVIAQLTLSASTDPRIASINFPCGDLSFGTTFRITDSGTIPIGTPASIGGIYVGLATNQANVAQAENVVQASRSTTQSFANGADTTILFTTETKDTFNEYDPSTGYFTAKRSGDYFISTTWLSDTVSWTTGSFLQLQIMKNSSSFCRSYKRIDSTQTMNVGITVTCTVSLSVGDSIRSNISQNQATMNSIADGTYVFTSISRFPSSSELVVTPERQNVWGGVVYTNSSEKLRGGQAASGTYYQYNNATWNQPTMLKGKAAVTTTDSGNNLGFSIPNMPVGNYKLTFTGLLNATNEGSTSISAAVECSFRIYETTTATSVAIQAHKDTSVLSNTTEETRDYINAFVGVFNNTSVATRNFRIEAAKAADSTTSTIGSCQAYSGTAGTSTNIAFLLEPLDQPSNSALYVQGPVKAAGTGTAVPTGYVGQTLTNTRTTTLNLTGGVQNYASVSLSAGIWQCVAYLTIEPAAGTFSTARLSIDGTATVEGLIKQTIVPPSSSNYITSGQVTTTLVVTTGLTVYANIYSQAVTGGGSPPYVRGTSESGIQCWLIN